MDLKKAYDSVPCAPLWHALERLGVPGRVITFVRSFHEDMKAWISINCELLEGEIEADNGLRQGCTLAPTLFNLHCTCICQPGGGDGLHGWLT